jgi:hypothetical protein
VRGVIYCTFINSSLVSRCCWIELYRWTNSIIVVAMAGNRKWGSIRVVDFKYIHGSPRYKVQKKISGSSRMRSGRRAGATFRAVAAVIVPKGWDL